MRPRSRVALVLACGVLSACARAPGEWTGDAAPGSPATSAPHPPGPGARASLGPTVLSSFAFVGERGVDEPVMAGAPDAQDEPVFAWGGTTFLAVWADRRSLEGTEIRGARLAPDGAVLDPVGFPIGAGPGERARPAVAWDGSAFLVAWVERGPDAIRRVRTAAVSPEGLVTGAPADVAGVAGTEPPDRVAVAASGAGWVVVWAEGIPSPWGVRAAVLTPDRTLLATGQVRPAPARMASVACAGGACLVGWTEGFLASEILLAPVSPSDATLLAPPVPLSAALPGDQSDLVLGESGGGLVAAWLDAPSGVVVRAARIAGDGTFLEPEGVPVSVGAGARPALAGDGATVAVTWDGPAGTDGRDLWVRRLEAASLAALDGAPLAVAAGRGDQRAATLAAGGGALLLGWSDGRDLGVADVYAARLPPEGLEPEVLLSRGGNAERDAAVAFGGGEYLVVWRDTRRYSLGLSGIYGARVSRTGETLDPAGFLIADGGASETRPAVAYGAGTFLVLWEDRRQAATGTDLFAARVAVDGTVTDPGGFAIAATSGEQLRPAVTGSPGGFFAAWEDTRFGALDIRGASLGPDGRPRSPGIVPVALASGCGTGLTPACSSPALASGAGLVVAAWQATGGGTSEVRAARLLADGTQVPLPLAAGGGARGEPAVSFGGGAFLVAWTELVGPGPAEVRGRRVSPAGAALDATPLLLVQGTGGRGHPALAFGGARHVLLSRSPATGDLHASSVAAGGTVAGGDVLAAGSPRAHALACDGWGGCLATYDRADVAPTGVSRVLLRGLADLRPSVACSAAAPCPDGTCVDGFCCDVPCGGGTAADCLACSVAAGGALDGTCAPAAPGTTCRAAAGGCDAVERCDGAATTCPADQAAEDATPCDDGDRCTLDDHCLGGTCAAGPAEACLPSDTCHLAGACDPATGRCSDPPAPEGAPCDDGDGCTAVDGCAAGRCVGSAPLQCPPPGACLAGLCDPATGACGAVALPDGVGCDDGDPCTLGDACRQGTCAAGPPAVCAARDACHVAGACDPATGRCSEPAAPDGTACDDGDACTTVDRCGGGACQGASPVECAPAGACRTAGTCDPATGRCSDPPAADGTACDDGDACSALDLCAGGACLGAGRRACEATDACHRPGTCDAVTGACSDPAAPDGTACPGGACDGGTCLATPPPPPAAPVSGGCGCGSAGAPDGAALALLALMARRRRGRARPGSLRVGRPVVAPPARTYAGRPA